MLVKEKTQSWLRIHYTRGSEQCTSEHWDWFGFKVLSTAVIASFSLIPPGIFSVDIWTRLSKILALVQWNMSFRSRRNAWCVSPFFAWLLLATCSQGEKWDQRFHSVRRDLNKWSSSKTIFPHLSGARRFICFVICNRVRRLMGAMDEGKHRVELEEQRVGGLQVHARLVER